MRRVASLRARALLGLAIPLAWFGLAGFGCEGVIGDGHDEPRAPGPCIDSDCDPGDPLPVASSAYPRLSHPQWENTVRNLFEMSEGPDLTGSFSSDPSGTTHFDNDTTVLQVTPNHWQDYQRGAELVAQQVIDDPALFGKLVAGVEGDVPAFVARFLRDAYRRPPTAAETSTYEALAAGGPTAYPEHPAFTAAVRFVVEAALQSPHFLYRNEDGELRDGVVHLDDWQLASRLSYTLWDSMPDDILFAAAAAGELTGGEGLREQAARMLDNDKADEKLRAFHRQLFELDVYDSVRVDGIDGVGASMRQEAEHYVTDVVIANDGSLRDLLTSSFSYVNKDLAPLYGLEGSSYGSEMERVELDPTQRAGLFTQPGFLASHAGDTAPILRGIFVNLKVLCAKMPEPPVFEPPELVGATRRERVDSITGRGTCGESCHAQVINPIGFAFENFDDVGRWREEDSGNPVDATSAYRFSDGLQSFDGPVELAQAMAESPNAHSCYAQNWLEFALGRPMLDEDWPLVNTLARESQSRGLSVKELLVRLVDSTTFRHRLPLPAVEEDRVEESR